VPFTKETAREMSRRGVEARRENAARRAEMRADVRAKEILASSAEALAKELVNAALGRGEYTTLAPRERFQATLKALEWGIGRPGPAARLKEPRKERSEEPYGLRVT
jgi:hypothetical protein